jgi:hypothetical protein
MDGAIGLVHYEVVWKSDLLTMPSSRYPAFRAAFIGSVSLAGFSIMVFIVLKLILNPTLGP